MPWNVNGCGTMYCGRAAAIHWQKPGPFSQRQADHDAVVCVTLLALPLVPLRACHLFDHSGDVHREAPLRWTPDLLGRAFLRPWLLGIAAISAFVLAVVLVGWAASGSSGTAPFPPRGVAVVALAALLFTGSLAGFAWLKMRDTRNRDIRLILGPHAFGSSDPAMWVEATRREAKVRERFAESENLIAAGRAALEARAFPKAMLAARLAVAQGETALGEQLTDEILRDLRILEFMEDLRKEPWRRGEWLPSLDAPGAEARGAAASGPSCSHVTDPERTQESGTLFYDNRVYTNAVLDGAGGQGFAEFTRAHPLLVRSVPSHPLVLVTLGAALLLFGSVTVVEFFSSSKPDRWNVLLGGMLLSALFGGCFYGGCARQVILGEGKLWVGRLRGRGRETLLDAVTDIGRRRWLGLFSVICVRSVGAEITWPYRKGRTAEIERAIEAAIRLRAQSTELARG